MRKKLMTALTVGGCLLGFLRLALAQDLAEHPSFAPSHHAYRPQRGGPLYNFYGSSAQCIGTYVPSSDICYPLDFQGPTH